MKRKSMVYLILSALLLLGMAASVRYGSVPLDGRTFLDGLLGRDDTAAIILWYRRIPRMLGGLLAGVGLSLSGVLLQAVTGNPLCGPNIIGVNAGAGVAVMLCLSFGAGNLLLLPVGAFLGAFLTTLLITLIAARAGGTKSAAVLAGIAISSIYQAAISFFSLLDTEVLVSYNAFSVGGLAEVSGEALIFPGILIFLSLAAALCLSRRITVLTLGDTVAASLGLGFKGTRMCCLLLASGSAAAVVSFAGLLGFVGLMIPHITRRLVGHGIRDQLAASALAGAVLVIGGDLLGRVLAPPTEIPVGILMALLGAPFFLVLLLKNGERDGRRGL